MLILLGRYARKNQKQQQIQLSERYRREQEQEARQRQKLHDTQEEIFLEQKMQAQNISLFLKEVSQQLGALQDVDSQLRETIDQNH
jgi:hypothetical protein